MKYTGNNSLEMVPTKEFNTRLNAICDCTRATNKEQSNADSNYLLQIIINCVLLFGQMRTFPS